MSPTNEILFVSSFPPRECGIATYSQDLLAAIEEKFGNSYSVKVCALENGREKRKYGNKVKYILHTDKFSAYEELAETINKDPDVKLVFVQHEFGLFSGQYGENILNLLYTLTKPVLLTFHTVLPGPDAKRRQVVRDMAASSDGIIVMTESSSGILRDEYQIAPEKISVIPHGTHLLGSPEKERLKTRYALQGKQVLSTFGLLSPGKSIETALDALPAIIEKFPDVIYLVIGKTHPEVVKQEGERYREFLHEKIKAAGTGNHVRFVNRYLELDQLLEYLELTDIYLFTSKDPHQAVSGTFSYAMGCACAVISTPIPHATELLKDEAGVIIGFQNPEQLARETINLLSDPELRKRISMNALHKISPTSWQNSAIAHAELFRKWCLKGTALKYSYPAISLDHIKRLTTPKGIIQFAEISSPDVSSGYTLDDNARALIALTNHYKLSRSPSDLSLIAVYRDFITFSQQPDGKFLNYVDEEGNYHEKNNEVNLEDSMGRAVWALGEFISNKYLFNESFSQPAESAMAKALKQVRNFKSPRACAFVIKGLHYYNRVSNSKEAKELIKELADNLIAKYHHLHDKDWQWFENYLTYANSILPESLLYAYLSTGNERYREVARSSFDFLLSIIFQGERIKVISNRGWHKRGETSQQFGEQPIDVAYTVLALDLFYNFFGDEKYRTMLETAFSWFHGNNHLHQVIYNPATGGCHDGLEEHNVNLNQGAESTISYLLARLAIEKRFLTIKKFRPKKKIGHRLSGMNITDMSRHN